jgi:hypothetical protein
MRQAALAKEALSKPVGAPIRTFETGATRDTEEGKLDFEGFLSPLALEAFAEYMNENRLQRDGTRRDSDNWQKGIPKSAYMKSMFRHFFAVWKLHRASLEAPLSPALENKLERDLAAMFFNVQGYLHELIKTKHSSWSYQILAEAAKAGEKIVEETYAPDTRPVEEGALRGSEEAWWGPKGY